MRHSTTTTDEEAEALAQEARERGTNLIRDHLSSHLEQNPGSSFVTWIATLHPENAQVAIDHRFFVPNNPWWTVYEEAKSVPVVAIEIVDDDQLPAASAPSTQQQQQQQHTATHQEIARSHSRCNLYSCSPVELIIGFSVGVSAFGTVFGMELAAFAMYFVSSIFYHLAQLMKRGPMVITGFFFGLFSGLYYIFAGVESLLLFISVFISELLAGICCGVCCFFVGCSRASLWHQYIRRTCHLIRWAFRQTSLSSPRLSGAEAAADNGCTNHYYNPPTSDDDIPEAEVTTVEHHHFHNSQGHQKDEINKCTAITIVDEESEHSAEGLD